MIYLVLKWVHILAVITAVGANITYGVWLARAAHERDHLSFVLRGIQFLDGRIANPAYAVALLAGLGMVFAGGFSLTTPWILVSLVLFILVGGIGGRLYTPTLKRQIELAESGQGASSDYSATAARGQRLGMLMAVLVIIIIALMVSKPALWA